MKRICVFALAVGLLPSIASADLAPFGDPVFGTTISQGATGMFGQPYYGFRVVAPPGFNGAYIDNMAGVGSLVTGKYELRDDFPSGPVSQLVEGWWNLNGSNSITVTLEIADPSTFPSSNAADYVGLRTQNVLATATGDYFASREWVFTNGADPSTIPGIGAPTGGGSWIPWGSWYLSPFHYDDSAWSGCPIPVPGAVLLGAMGVGMVGWLTRRARKAKT